MARTRTTAKAGKKKNVISLDLSNVEGRVLVPEGDYHLKVKGVSQEEGNAADYLKWEFVIVGGKFDGKSIKPYNTSLSPQALWNLRGLLEALDFEVPDSAFELDPEELVDLEMMGSIEHDEYEGRKSSALVDFWPLDGEAGGEEPEEEEESTEEEGDDDAITQEEILDMDQDELEEFVKENKLKGVDFKKLKTLAKMRAAVVDAAETAGILAAEDDEPEEEPEPEPVKPARRTKRK